MQAIAGVYVFTESLPLDLFCDLVQLGFRLETSFIYTQRRKF